MQRDVFIEMFLKVLKKSLEAELPLSASEGVFIYKSYELSARTLKHILIAKGETQ